MISAWNRGRRINSRLLLHALGNIVDRLFRGEGWLRGAVVDFIDLQWFPIFNIADIAVNVGAALLILGSVLAARSHRREQAAPTGETAA